MEVIVSPIATSSQVLATEPTDQNSSVYLASGIRSPQTKEWLHLDEILSYVKFLGIVKLC
jgi:rhodanese-related sulfurtransferase